MVACLLFVLAFDQDPARHAYHVDSGNMWRAERDLHRVLPHLDDPNARKAVIDAFRITKVRTIAIEIAEGTARRGSLAIISQWQRPMEEWRLSELVLSLERLEHPRRLELVERFCRDRRSFVRAAAFHGFLSNSAELKRLYELVSAEPDPKTKEAGILCYGLKRLVASQKGVQPLPPKFAKVNKPDTERDQGISRPTRPPAPEATPTTRRRR